MLDRTNREKESSQEPCLEYGKRLLVAQVQPSPGKVPYTIGPLEC
jgi:hypothetical protein